MTKVFFGSLATETNTFSPIPTEGKHFYEWYVYKAGEHPDSGPTLFTGALWAARERASEWGWSVHQGLCAAAFPSGVVLKSVYEDLRDELLSNLRDVGGAEIVLLGLHGAMVAQGYDDCEGDIIQRVRAVVGPDAVIAATLDPHCHLTAAMLEGANLLICFKEYPHTDAMDRARELVALAERAYRREIVPVMRAADAGMIAQFLTTTEPARSLVRRMQDMERAGEVLSASLIHGFASGDVADMGTKALAIVDGSAAAAASAAQDIARRAWEMRTDLGPRRVSVDEAITLVQKADHGPIVLADGADNPGGGAPGDSTYLLAGLLEANQTNVAIGALWDPLALSIAKCWGEGARIDLRIGGKASRFSGKALDLEVTVGKIVENAVQAFAGATWPLGDLVRLHAGDTDIVLCSLRNQCFSPSVLEDVGVDLAKKKAVIVKSNQHFFAGFQPIAADIVYVGAPGVAVIEPRGVPYKRVRRALWPMANAAADV